MVPDEEKGQGTVDERKLHQDKAVERIVDFSNGVLGFAATLLVVNLRLPDVSLAPESLPGELLELWPQFLAYLLSFFIIGDNWIVYNRIFSHIERVDERLYWMNLFYLFFIAVLPFPTNLVSVYPDRKLPVLLYGGIIICVGFTRTLIAWYTTRNHRLVHANLDLRFVHRAVARTIIVLFGYLAGAVIVFFLPIESVYVWIFLALVAVFTRWGLYRGS